MEKQYGNKTGIVFGCGDGFGYGDGTGDGDGIGDGDGFVYGDGTGDGDGDGDGDGFGYGTGDGYGIGFGDGFGYGGGGDRKGKEIDLDIVLKCNPVFALGESFYILFTYSNGSSMSIGRWDIEPTGRDFCYRSEDIGQTILTELTRTYAYKYLVSVEIKPCARR